MQKSGVPFPNNLMFQAVELREFIHVYPEILDFVLFFGFSKIWDTGIPQTFFGFPSDYNESLG